jgi:hypothetical protein
MGHLGISIKTTVKIEDNASKLDAIRSIRHCKKGDIGGIGDVFLHITPRSG